MYYVSGYIRVYCKPNIFCKYLPNWVNIKFSFLFNCTGMFCVVGTSAFYVYLIMKIK